MRLSADMKWMVGSSTTKMREHLVDYVCNEKSDFKGILEQATRPYSDQVEMRVKCGKVITRSYFVFLKCSRKKSRIIGTCSTNKLVDLIDDFDFLKEQMKKSNLTFNLSDPKVFLDNNELFNIEDKRGLSMKIVLPELLGTAGFVSGATSYLIFGEFNIFTVVAFILGFIFWVGASIFGSGNRPKYVLIEPE